MAETFLKKIVEKFSAFYCNCSSVSLFTKFCQWIIFSDKPIVYYRINVTFLNVLIFEMECGSKTSFQSEELWSQFSGCPAVFIAYNFFRL